MRGLKTAQTLNEERRQSELGKRKKQEEKERQRELELEEDQKRKKQKKEEKEKKRENEKNAENGESDIYHPKKYSINDFYQVFKEHYGSIYNLYGICGAGTYCILAPTEQGKSHWIKQAYGFATSKLCKKENRLEFKTKIVLSTISKYNKDYDWDDELVHLEPSNEMISFILDERKAEMKEACKKLNLDLNEAEDWAIKNPMLIMADDTYGLVDFTTPGNSGSRLCTKARHYGIYFVLAAQYVHQLGPVFHDNARVWVCLSCAPDNHKKIIEKHHGVLHKELMRKCIDYNKQMYFLVIYVTTWYFGRKFHVPANRVFGMPPIPSAEIELSKKQEMENRYKELEDTEDY